MARKKIWIEPVTDRTLEDVNYIKSLEVKDWNNLDESEKLFWFLGNEENLNASNSIIGTVGDEKLMCYTKIIRGAINAYDLNRIEKNCTILAEMLNHHGYAVNIAVKTNWSKIDFPHLSEINRVRDNVNALLDVCVRKAGSPDIRYWNSLSWVDANALEKNIKNIEALIREMIAEYRYSGEFYSGEV